MALGVAIPMALSLAHSAHADDASPATLSAARDLFRAATDDFDAARYDDALEKFRRVASVRETSAVRFNIAQCEEKLGKNGSAFSSFELAAELARREGEADVEKRARDRADAVRPRAPRLVIAAPPRAPADLVVTVDGQREPAATWGAPLPVDAGDHVVEATAAGRKPFHRDLTARDAEITNVAIVLDADPSADAAGAGSTRRTIGIVAMGAGAALGVGALVFLVLHNSGVSDLNAACSPTCPASRYDDLESTRTSAVRDETLSWVFAAGATAGLGVGAALFFTAPRDSRARDASGASDSSDAPQRAVWLAPGGPRGIPGATLHARF